MGSNSPSHGTFHGEIDSPWDSKMEHKAHLERSQALPTRQVFFFSSRGLKTWGKKKQWILHVLVMFSIGHPTAPALQRPQNPKLLHLPLLLQFPAQDGLTWRGPKSSDWDKRQTKGQWIVIDSISGWRFQPLKNMTSSVGMIIPFPINMESHNPAIFQTTSQSLIPYGWMIGWPWCHGAMSSSWMVGKCSSSKLQIGKSSSRQMSGFIPFGGRHENQTREKNKEKMMEGKFNGRSPGS